MSEKHFPFQVWLNVRISLGYIDGEKRRAKCDLKGKTMLDGVKFKG